jgi:hypothetical protein
LSGGRFDTARCIARRPRRAEIECGARRGDIPRGQARARLHFVLPGERQYIVTGATTEAEENKTEVANNIPVGLPWYNRLIASITETGAK